MDDKQFYTALSLLLTFVILSGTYFIGNYIFLQSSQTNFDKQINTQDHKTLGQVNATVNEILAILKGGGGSVPLTPVPAPLPPVVDNQTKICDNGTSIPIENITTNKLPANQC